MSCAIGIVPYINMRAYTLLPPPDGCDVIQLSPRHMVQEFKDGRLAAAAIPVGGLFELKGKYDFLSAFGISAKERIDSVLLFSKRPFDQLDSNCNVTLSGESATSNQLLKLLLGYEVGFNNMPCFVRQGEQADAELIIGDAALKRQHHAATPYVTDLAQCWWERYNLPFVFARWVIAPNASKTVREGLSTWLESVAVSRDQWLPMVAQEAATALDISIGASEDYLHRVHYRIDMPAQHGQMLFQQEIKRYALLSTDANRQPTCKQMV